MELHFRKAKQTDLSGIVEMLSDDELGKKREDFRVPLPEVYHEAFERINQDPNQELVVAETPEGYLVGTLQLSFIPYLTYQGGIRAQIEAVRIHRQYRSMGLGHQLFKWAISRAQERGAHLLQLTTDKQRPDALRFYEDLGFSATHEGMKLHFLPQSESPL
jgi:GNAT superfamily N-acetyltransferase